jgi:hypothetical protein
VIDSLITIHVASQANDPNEAWSLFADEQGFLHITCNGGDAIDPLPLEEVFAVYLDAGDGNDSVDRSAVHFSVVVHGGEGNDFILTGSGTDSIFGDAGNDFGSFLFIAPLAKAYCPRCDRYDPFCRRSPTRIFGSARIADSDDRQDLPMFGNCQ